MDAPTAGHLLRQITARQRQADAMRVADLGDAERTAVVAALERVSSRARVDVDKLIATVRADVAKRAEAEAATQPDMLGILRYELLLKSPEELLALRADLSARVERGEGDQPFRPGSPGAEIMHRLDGIADRLGVHADDVEQPDPDLVEPDEHEPPKRRRGRVPRRSPRQAQDAPGAPTEARSPARAATRPARPSARLLGPKAFDAYGSLTPEPVDHFPPPWLLPDDPNDEDRDAA